MKTYKNMIYMFCDDTQCFFYQSTTHDSHAYTLRPGFFYVSPTTTIACWSSNTENNSRWHID